MILDGDAFDTHERVLRQLAAQDRIAEVRRVYERYHAWDWEAALLADLMIVGMMHSGDRDTGMEMDAVRAERVAGVRFQGAAIAHYRKLFGTTRRELRDLAERPFFDFGRWEEQARGA